MLYPTASQLITYRHELAKFVEFTEEEWLVFCGHLYVRHLKKKELFVDSDKVSNEIGFIISGSMRLFYIKDGMEISNYFCFKLDLITSYGSFLQRRISRISIEALEDAELICFSYRSLQSLFSDHRIAYKAEKLSRLIAEYLVCCYEDRVLSFVTKNPEERYLELLYTQPELIKRIPQHYLANFLGVTPVSLSRIRKRVSINAGKQKKIRA